MTHASFDAVRPAVPGDLDALLALESEFPEADRISRRSWRRFLDHKDCVFVCDDGGSLAAAAVLLTRKKSRNARLYSLAVAPHARGKGHARLLLAACEQVAKDNGRESLALEVRIGNGAAIALYRKAGFETKHVIADYYDDGEDAFRMAKSLEAAGEQN